MTTLLEERLNEALSKKDTNINSYIWKGNKELTANGTYQQSKKKLISMSEVEINECYDHCKTMLFNQDTQNPGRYLVLDIIADQRDRCGVELFLRYIEQERNIARFSLVEAINNFLSLNREALKGVKPMISTMFSGIPNEFEKLPLSLIIDGCLDRLGTFNKKHITRTFILKQGIWLTPSESKELIEYDTFGNLIDRLEIIRDRLNIKEVEQLYINSKGLNYTQMRAMLNIKPNKKYIDLTTVQLETLRNRLLFNLEETVKGHILSWETRMEELTQVAEFKNYRI